MTKFDRSPLYRYSEIGNLGVEAAGSEINANTRNIIMISVHPYLQTIIRAKIPHNLRYPELEDSLRSQQQFVIRNLEERKTTQSRIFQVAFIASLFPLAHLLRVDPQYPRRIGYYFGQQFTAELLKYKNIGDEIVISPDEAAKKAIEHSGRALGILRELRLVASGQLELLTGEEETNTNIDKFTQNTSLVEILAQVAKNEFSAKVPPLKVIPDTGLSGIVAKVSEIAKVSTMLSKLSY